MAVSGILPRRLPLVRDGFQESFVALRPGGFYLWSRHIARGVCPTKEIYFLTMAGMHELYFKSAALEALGS